MRLQLITGLATTALLAGNAWAEAPNSNYLELSYSTGEMEIGIDGLGSEDIDQDGIKLEGNFVANDSFLLRASYAMLSGDKFGVDLDTDTLILGAGYILATGDSTAVDLGLEYRTDDLKVSDSFDSISDDVNGVGLSAAIRSNVSDNVELYARASYLTGDYDGGISLDLSATFYVTEQFGLSAGIEYLDADDDGVSVELSQVLLGARYRF